MNIIIFGPQGSGKGTQADLIAKKSGLYHMSMGDELRAEVNKDTALGKKISEMINVGNLVPDDIANKLLMARASAPECSKGLIFDGYPRTSAQLEFMMRFKVSAAIEITLSEEESVKRIASRRMCPKCGRNYNIIYIRPKKEGICDIDGTRLVQRDDDKPAEIRKRLEIYKKQTEPLKKYYEREGILHVINGDQSIPDVARDIDKVLTKL